MNGLQENTMTQSIPWFRRWFDSTYYHKLYAHRDEQEARTFIDGLMRCLQPPQHSTMIDVGCGTGRHCKYLAAKGFKVTGIDLAFSSIKEANRSATKSLQFFQHDMRIPFGNQHYDLVFNFFTSFGYFQRHSEHDLVIRNMSMALKCAGKLVLDYINIPHAIRHLVPREKKEIDGVVYNITRWDDEMFIHKKISVDDTQMGKSYEHEEKVAKFTLNDFNQMFSAHRLQIEQVYGDYRFNSYNPDLSPRLIMIAAKI